MIKKLLLLSFVLFFNINYSQNNYLDEFIPIWLARHRNAG